ncbi:InlB B-repeat-containing protein [Raoultibacter phocaeensis]|uniref:InlB B-repeat-containing protein n=1 Tax=Raoultibacter phocaeensis TaxID=2479841 RepID=UPI00111B0C15|nr:InlB B-repeat-containing protein [Raoultibacter phocaeensis]
MKRNIRGRGINRSTASVVLSVVLAIGLVMGSVPLAAADQSLPVESITASDAATDSATTTETDPAPTQDAPDTGTPSPDAPNSEDAPGHISKDVALEPAPNKQGPTSGDTTDPAQQGQQTENAQQGGQTQNDVPLTNDKPKPAVGTIVFEGLEYTLNPDGETVTLVGWYGEAPAGALVVPSKIVSGEDTYAVETIRIAGGGSESQRASEVTSLTLPDTVGSIDVESLEGLTGLVSISVSESNAAYASFDGMLFNKGLTELLLVPEGKEGAATIPDQTVSVLASTLSHSAKLTSVMVGNGSAAFTSVDGVLYNLDKTKALYCPAGAGDAVALPAETVEIGPGAFADAPLASIVVSGYVKTIDPSAFSDDAKANAVVALASGEDYDARKAVWEGAGFSQFAEPAQPGDTTSPGRGEDGEEPGFAYTLLDDYTLAVSWQGGEGPGAELVIPASAEMGGATYRVSAIADGGFRGLGEIASAVIPSGVTTIGDATFSGCSSLASVSLAEGLRSIGAQAFADTAIEQVKVPASVANVGSGAFADCSSLSRIVAHTNAVEVAGDALAGCSNVAIYCPFEESGEYPWNPGLVASGNHVMPYGLALSGEPLVLEVGQEADLFEGGVREAPEGMELTYSYSATVMSVDAGVVTGKKAGTADVSVALEMDGEAFARASRTVEVAKAAEDEQADESEPIVPIGAASIFQSDKAIDESAVRKPFDEVAVPKAGVRVWFDRNDGTGSPLLYVDGVEGEVVTPPVVTRPGYTFEGWYTDPVRGSKWDFSQPYWANYYSTYYARWAPLASCTVTFNSNGGSAVAAQTVSSGSAVAAPANPSRTGYAFAGWFTAPTGGAPYNFASAVTSNFTLFAQWTPNTYTVLFDSNGGSAVGQRYATHGSAVAAPANPSRLGYTFAGWFTAPTGGAPYNFASAVTSSFTLYAHWTANAFAVTLNPGTGAGVAASRSYAYEVPGQALPSAASLGFSKNGYAFKGWTVAADGSGALIADGADASRLSTGAPVTLHAQWKANSYTVKFDAGEGSLGSVPAQMAATFDQDVALPAAKPSRRGYTFLGWSSAAGAATAQYSAGQVLVKPNFASDPGGTATLHAVWQANTYTVRFDPNATAGQGLSGGPMPDQTFTFDADPQALTANAYSRTGYRFAGWTENADGAGAVHPDKDPVRNLAESGTVTLYAKWEANAYFAIFFSNAPEGATVTTSGPIMQQLTYDAKAALQPTPFSCSGYSFVGWNTEADGSGTPYADGAEVLNLTSAHSGMVSLYAQWRGSAYTVKFDKNAADATGTMGDLELNWGVRADLPASPFKRDGWSFAGWSTEPDGTGSTYADGENVRDLPPAGSNEVVLYARWTPVISVTAPVKPVLKVTADALSGTWVSAAPAESQFVSRTPVSLRIASMKCEPLSRSTELVFPDKGTWPGVSIGMDAGNGNRVQVALGNDLIFGSSPSFVIGEGSVEAPSTLPVKLSLAADDKTPVHVNDDAVPLTKITYTFEPVKEAS